MAESTLSLNYAEMRIAIAHYLGLTLTSTDWSADEIVLINMILKRGLRQFYKPPKIRTDQEPHRWSFLSPTTTLTTIASYATGTLAITEDDATVTLSDGIFPSWTATHGTLVVGTTEYAIDSRTDDTHLELSAVWPEDTITAEEYTLRHNGNYDMDEDFGGMDGRYLTHGEGVNKPDILIVNEATIRKMRASTTSRGEPQNVAIRPKNTTVTSSVGQRFEVMFYPIPNDAYTLYYRKIVQIGVVTSILAYPLGGMAYGEAILASCLAVAEQQENGVRGPEWESFISNLTSAIQEDMTAMQTDYHGYNSDDSDAIHRKGRGRHRDPNVIATYNGEF